VRLPTFAGRKRPSLKTVVPAILDAVMALPDQGGVRWRDVNPSNVTVVDDQRECGNLAALERNFLVRRTREPSGGAEDHEDSRPSSCHSMASMLQLPDQCVCRVAVDGVEGAKRTA